MSRRVEMILFAVFLAAVTYWTASQTVFAFRHPRLTDTERFLHFRDALLWRTLP